jgi:hypothetical protein
MVSTVAQSAVAKNIGQATELTEFLKNKSGVKTPHSKIAIDLARPT